MAGDIAVPALVVGRLVRSLPDDVLRSFEDLAPERSVRARTSTGSSSDRGPLGVVESGRAFSPIPTPRSLRPRRPFWDFYLRRIPNDGIGSPRFGLPDPKDTWHSRCSINLGSQQSQNYTSQPAEGLDNFTVGGYFLFNPFDPSIEDGPQDLSRAVETRPDVLVYTTPVLAHDLRVTGSVSVDLFVSSDRSDTDFCVRLTDVYPDGRSLIVTQGIRRMRFRNSNSTEELMTPGQVYPVTVELQDLALTFLPGRCRSMSARRRSCHAGEPKRRRPHVHDGPFLRGR